MFKTLIAAAGLAAALSLSAAGSAFALDTSCLWNGLTPAKRTELVGLYKSKGLAGLDNLPLVDADFTGWDTKCGVTPDNAERAGMLLGTAILENGIAEQFSEKYKIDPKALAAAVKRVDPAARAEARADTVRVLNGQAATGSSATATDQVVTSLKLPDQAREQVALYLFAMLARELKSPD